MGFRASVAAAVLVPALGAACGPLRPSIAEAPASAPACRAAVDADGRAAAARIDWRAPAEDGAALANWCAAVGPAVVAPAPAGAANTEPPGPRAELTVISWNAHVGGGDLAGLVDALRDGRLTNGRPVGEFVLLLQEAYRAGPTVPIALAAKARTAGRIDERPREGERDIVTAARALGLSLYYVPSMRNGRGVVDGVAEDRGNAILSTRPLSDFAALELPFERQRRVAIAASVDGATEDGRPWRVRVASAHLDATASLKRLRVFASGVRSRQARQLAAALDDGVPTILGADLNTWAGGQREPAYELLRSIFPRTVGPAWRATSQTGFLLDYVLLRVPDDWRVSTRRLDSRFGSDHHPLIAELSLPYIFVAY
jgi:endonuclease/exonuclease/phosphatase family metal-dependent hydrolase